MNQNEIVSTLFKFISLRNPQPPKPEEHPVRFSAMPVELKTGHFYTAVINRPANMLKSEAMIKAAEQFTGVLQNSDIKNIAGSLYNFSEWIIQNKSNFKHEEFIAKARAATPLNIDKVKQLWENLFYQTIRSESFEAKESIMKVLVGQHAVTKLKDTDPEYNKMLANVKITLPSELYTQDVQLEGLEEEPVSAFIAMDKNIASKMAANNAKLLASNVNILKQELDFIETEYKKSYNTEYQRAKDLHESTITPIMDQYYAALKTAKQDSCAIRTSNFKYDPNDPCHQPAEVPYPKLPVFEFTPVPEIDLTEMQSRLSRKSYGVLLETLGSKDPFIEEDTASATMAIGAMPIPEMRFPTTFSGMQKKLDVATTASISNLKDNVAFKKSKISLGGTLVNIAKNTTSLSEDRFIISGTRSGFTHKYSIWAGIDTEETILKATVKKVNPNGEITATMTYPSPVMDRNGLTIELDGLFDYTLSQNEYINPPTFEIELYLSSGNIKTLKNISPLLHNIAYTGKLTSLIPTKEISTIIRNFTPSGFGFKQLGIADYLKVEQSVQCYVEGEVSHIENVMAREYKEKATRRLVRTENTTTTSSETEREKMTDTSTADRFEMQTEVAKVIQESKDISGSVNSRYNGTGFQIDAGLAYANSSATEQSNNIAVAQAKEVTERALDRVVARVKEERIRKVIEEFEENNKHGFDNRAGNEHVVGVYRWVDKLYKNQIFNYGRRLMFEFMIPDPARLHILGMSEDEGEKIPKPDNPTSFPEEKSLQIESASKLDEANANYWAALYNVEIEPYPQKELSVGKSLAYGKDLAIPDNGGSSAVGLKDEVEIPEGYESITISAVGNGKTQSGASLRVAIGNNIYTGTSTNVNNAAAPGFVKKMPVSVSADRYWSFNLNVSVKCKLTQEYIDSWKQRTFKAIMEGYQKALDIYNERQAEEKNKEVITKKANPGFYRDIEHLILRKNCIAYLLKETSGANNTYGRNMANLATKKGVPITFSNYEVTLSQNLTAYGNFAKFIEQAFEWDIMSYNFYPYYWAGKDTWKDKYQFDESSDPVFRSFMQAGMARVIVTVRPGFEESVYHYIKTGVIWNGGQVPVIGDDSYMGIVDEVRTIPSEPIGKAWLTRVPTDLTILQAGSIGLKVEKALPCDCTGIEDFENPEAIPCNSNFEITNAKLGEENSSKESIEFILRNIDNFVEPDAYKLENYEWPIIYECQGQTINVVQDWNNGPASLIYDKLASQLSDIPGLKVKRADLSQEDSLHFTIDTTVISNFSIKKIIPQGPANPELKVSIVNNTVTFTYQDTITARLLDGKKGIIPASDWNTPLPLSRFLA